MPWERVWMRILKTSCCFCVSYVVGGFTFPVELPESKTEIPRITKKEKCEKNEHSLFCSFFLITHHK